MNGGIPKSLELEDIPTTIGPKRTQGFEYEVEGVQSDDSDGGYVAPASFR
jgi:hypothetical protein